MKKNLLIIILFFCFFPIIGKAMTKEEMHKVDLKEVMSFEFSSEFQGSQGLAITDKYIFFSVNKKDDSSVSIYIYDKFSYELVQVIENVVYGHANDMTYEESTNEVLIIDGHTIHVLDADSFEEKESRYLDTASWSISNNSLSYAFLSNKVMYIYEKESMKKNFEFNVETNLIAQGIKLYNDHIFVACYESGSVNVYEPVYDGILEAGANAVYVYSMDGTLIKVFYIPTGYGELESIDFSNGLYYLVFNSLDKPQSTLYTFSIPSETLTVQIPMTLNEKAIPLSNFKANVYQHNNLIDTIPLNNDVYAFSLTFEDQGVYEYIVKQEKNADYITYDDKDVYLSYVVGYDELENQLQVNPISETIPSYNNEVNREVIACEEISGMYYNPEGKVVDRNTFVNECHVVENPQTGPGFPLLVFATGVIFAGFLIIVFTRNLIYKL